MKPEDVEELVTRPESEELQFKTRLPDLGHLAELVSAFANTKGGRLVIGVQEGGNVVGVENIDRTRSRIEQALRTVSPSVDAETEAVVVQGKPVLVVKIPEGKRSPYLAGGRAFERVGDQIIPLTSQVLYSSITKSATSTDDLRAAVERLSQTVESLNNQLTAARGWQTRITNMVIGGLIAAAISVPITLVIR